MRPSPRRLQRFDLKTVAVAIIVQNVPRILFDATVWSYSPEGHVLLYTEVGGSSSSQIMAFPL